MSQFLRSSISGILLTTSYYGLHLFIRSTTVIWLRDSILKEVRIDAKMAPGTRILTRLFLAWMWHRVGLFVVLSLGLVTLYIIPSAVLLNRDVDSRYKASMSVLILVAVLIAYIARKGSVS